MTEKIDALEVLGSRVELKINTAKAKAGKMKVMNMDKFEDGGEEIEDVDKYSYLGSIVSRNEAADEDVVERIKKANPAFLQVYPIWCAREISHKTHLRILSSIVQSVLPKDYATWKVTDANKKQTSRVC